MPLWLWYCHPNTSDVMMLQQIQQMYKLQLQNIDKCHLETSSCLSGYDDFFHEDNGKTDRSSVFSMLGRLILQSFGKKILKA